MRLHSAVRRAAPLFFLLSILASPSARAQTVKAAVPPADDVEAAKAHFAAGSAYYEQADYADAVKEFNEAYRLSKRSDLLYNIAVCYERLNDYDHAIAALDEYLRTKPNAPDRLTIESRIANLKKAKAAHPPAPPPPVVHPAAPAPAPAPAASPAQAAPTASVPESGARPAHWWVTGTVVGAAGIAILAGALGTGLASHAIYSDLTDKCPNKKCPADASLEDEQSRGRALQIASDVLVGVGAAATVAGVILLIVQSRRHHPTAMRQARVAPTPLGLEVRF